MLKKAVPIWLQINSRNKNQEAIKVAVVGLEEALWRNK